MVRKVFFEEDIRVETLCGIPGVSGSKDGINPTFDNPLAIVSDSKALYVMDSYTVRKIIDRTRV